MTHVSQNFNDRFVAYLDRSDDWQDEDSDFNQTIVAFFRTLWRKPMTVYMLHGPHVSPIMLDELLHVAEHIRQTERVPVVVGMIGGLDEWQVCAVQPDVSHIEYFSRASKEEMH